MLCRTCLLEIQDSNFFALTNNSTVAVIIKNQLALCIPEMLPEMVSDPVMCHSCVAALHSAFDFKYQCLQTEERIRNIAQSNGINNNTTGYNLTEMFPNICGEICANAFAGIAQDTQLISNTLLDIKCETISIDEQEVDLAKFNIQTLENNFIENVSGDIVDSLQSNKEHMSSTTPEGMCNLEMLCDSEELQLQFNCMLVEQPSSPKTMHVENELSVILQNNCSYNLEDWNRFEEKYLRFTYSKRTYTENCTPNYNTKRLHSRDNEEFVMGCKKSVPQPPMKRRRLLTRAAKDKIKMQTDSYNPKNVKRKKASYKKLKFIRTVVPSKSNVIKKNFKCSECEYTTKLQINLELHRVSHIQINDYECETKSDSNVQQYTTTCHSKESSKRNKGYEYYRYDYSKKKTCNYIKRKKYFKEDRCKDKSFKSDRKDTKILPGDKFLISDHMGDQSCSSDYNENNQNLKNDQFFTNIQSEDTSIIDHGKPQSVVSESGEDEFLTNDHIERGKKQHVEEQECIANESAEMNFIIEGSHNQDEKSNTFVEDHNSKKGKYLENYNFKENHFSKNITVQVDNPKSNDPMDPNQPEQNCDGNDDCHSKNDTLGIQPSKTDRIFIEHTCVISDHTDAVNSSASCEVEENKSMEDSSTELTNPTQENDFFKDIEESPLKSNPIEEDQLLKNDNDTQSQKQANKGGYNEQSFKSNYCEKTDSTSVEENKLAKSDHNTGENDSTQDGKSTSNNQFLNTNDQLSNGDHIKQNQTPKSDDIEGKTFTKSVNYVKKQLFKNTSHNDYGKKFFKGSHIGEFFKNTQIKMRMIDDCGRNETTQNSNCVKPLKDFSIKRKLKGDNVKHKFCNSDCSSEKCTKSEMENVISRCSASDNFEFCDCTEHTFAATLKRDVHERMTFLLRKQHSTEVKLNAKLLTEEAP